MLSARLFAAGSGSSGSVLFGRYGALYGSYHRFRGPQYQRRVEVPHPRTHPQGPQRAPHQYRQYQAAPEDAAPTEPTRGLAAHHRRAADQPRTRSPLSNVAPALMWRTRTTPGNRVGCTQTGGWSNGPLHRANGAAGQWCFWGRSAQYRPTPRLWPAPRPCPHGWCGGAYAAAQGWVHQPARMCGRQTGQSWRFRSGSGQSPVQTYHY